MIDIKKLFERKYADFMLEVEKRLDEKAIEEYETEKVRVGLKLFEKYENNTQQIDELSKKTLGNYIKKASKNAVDNMYVSDIYANKAEKASDDKKSELNKKSDERFEKSNKRLRGIEKATNKLSTNTYKKEFIMILRNRKDPTDFRFMPIMAKNSKDADEFMTDYIRNNTKEEFVAVNIKNNRDEANSWVEDTIKKYKKNKNIKEDLSEAFAVVRSKEDKSYVTYIPLKKGRASEDLEAIQKQGKYTVITYYQDENKARDKVKELTKRKLVKESKPISQDLENDIVKHLKTLSAPKLKKMINDAFDNLTNLKRPVTNGWDAPKTNNINELIDHIDDFCNNWNCTVDIKNNKIVKTSSLHEGVAETILDQLGGKRFLLMTGSSPLSKSENSVTVIIGKNKTSANRVKITLNGKDLYDVVFMQYRNLDNKVLKTFNDVYAEDLQDIFTDYTGLYTKL